MGSTTTTTTAASAAAEVLWTLSMAGLMVHIVVVAALNFERFIVDLDVVDAVVFPEATLEVAPPAVCLTCVDSLATSSAERLRFRAWVREFFVWQVHCTVTSMFLCAAVLFADWVSLPCAWRRRGHSQALTIRNDSR